MKRKPKIVKWAANTRVPCICQVRTAKMMYDEYIRTYVPEFVDRRTLPDNRDRLFEELSEVGLTWNDRFEFMVRHHGICGGSQITVERMSDEEQQKYLDYVKDLQSKEC